MKLLCKKLIAYNKTFVAVLMSVSTLWVVQVYAQTTAQSIENSRNQLPEIGVVASDAITIDKERVIGDIIMRQMRGQAPLVQDPVLQEYIQSIGNRIVIHADNTKFPFQFFMINNQVLNAFAFYGGHVGIHTGLIVASKTESELASVLAHEVAHVTQRHLARRVQMQKRSSPLQIASLIGGLLLAIADPEAGIAAVQASSAAGQQANINFTRNNEVEADNIGINILFKAGFDPMGASDFFDKLLSESRGRSTQLAFLQTHPLPADRVAQATTRARGYGIRNLPPSLDFHLAKARIQGRYTSTPQRNIALFYSLIDKGNSVEQIAAHYGLAISLFEAEQYTDAKQILDQLMSNDSENLFYLDLMTDIHIKQNEPRKAISLLSPLWLNKPQNSVLTLNLANAYISAQNYQPAVQMLRDLLLVDKENFLAYQLLNDAYNQNQMKKEAHMAQAEIYGLIAAYPLAIDELQFAYNQVGTDTLEKQRIKGRIAQFREAQASMMSLSI
jgi:predicted Zn-dependent protease